MTQPIEEKEEYNLKKGELFKQVLEKYKNEILVRVHPRETEEKYRSMKSDSYNNLWEIECIEQITDWNVLIGVFSTAQFMPKILKGVEPYIIFTFKLVLDDEGSEFLRETEKFVAEFKKFYIHQERIFVPENINELDEILNKLIG